MTDSDLSVYEKSRLENIRKNKEQLEKLGLGTFSLPDITNTAGDNGKPAGKKAKRIRKEVDTPVAAREGTRLSRRVRGEDPNGIKLEHQQPGDNVDIKAEQRRYDEPISGTIKMESLDFFPSVKDELEEEPIVLDSKYSELTNPIPEGTLKIVSNMIYSVEMHPSTTKLVAAVGDKRGNLAFWDVSDTITNCINQDFEPIVTAFKPHSQAISKIMYGVTDSNKIYMSSYDTTMRCMDIVAGEITQAMIHPHKEMITHFDLDSNGCCWLSTGDGDAGFFDPRSPKPIKYYELSAKKLNTIHVNPVKPMFAVCGLDRTIKIFDVRKLEAEPLFELEHDKSVNSAYWNMNGDTIVSVSFDDTVAVWTDFAIPICKRIKHDNNTGRWVQKFKAVMKRNDNVFCVGNKKRHVDVYSTEAKLIGKLSSNMTSIPAINVFHPTVNTIVSGNSSGRMTVWI